MFLPIKSDNGAVLPWEYMPAAAATYKAGQLLAVSGGQAAAIASALTTRPPYLCMADKTCAAGDLLPVTRISLDYIYETTLSAAATGAAVGSKLQVAAGGQQALYNSSTAGAFEVVSLDGLAAGDAVRGRWA
jgi:hypothetical protein